MFRVIYIIAAIILFASACKPADNAAFNKENSEAKPSVDTSEDPSSDATEVKVAAAVDYDLTVTSNSGAKVCEGEVLVLIMTDFNISFPEAIMQCASLEIDLSSMLGGAAGVMSGKDGETDQSMISHDKYVLSLAKLGPAKFDPPRPFLVGPIVTNNSKYKGFEKTYKTSLEVTDPVSKKEYKEKGEFTVEVLDHKGSYTNDVVGDKFDSVLHWEMRASGFGDIPAGLGLTLDKFEWWWNTKPIMIPKIVIEGYLSDFIEDKGGAAEIVGKVTLTLEVNNYKIK